MPRDTPVAHEKTSTMTPDERYAYDCKQPKWVWGKARGLWQSGKSNKAISTATSLAVKSITKKAKEENWQRKQQQITRMVNDMYHLNERLALPMLEDGTKTLDTESLVQAGNFQDLAQREVEKAADRIRFLETLTKVAAGNALLSERILVSTLAAIRPDGTINRDKIQDLLQCSGINANLTSSLAKICQLSGVESITQTIDMLDGKDQDIDINTAKITIQVIPIHPNDNTKSDTQ